MALTTTQVRKLRSKLDSKYVRTRRSNGADLHYVEGWRVIAEANRIFGYDAWDRRTLLSRCVWNAASGSHYLAAYTAKVRVSVRAGDVIITREGSGSCEAKAPSPGQAHELALKGAETDATKRALATFGNPFGLALYDPEQAGVQKTPNASVGSSLGPWVLRSSEGRELGSFEQPSGFAAGLRAALTEEIEIENLFAIWENNVETVRDLNRAVKHEALAKTGFAPQLVNHLKQCAIALAKPATPIAHPKVSEPVPSQDYPQQKIDKSVLAISEPKRHRSKDHLRFVAQQPCLVCGRSPSHAHHIRFAQSRGLSLKVSDEFTVPLCAAHHFRLHTVGDERQWWKEWKLDPIVIAERLWKESSCGAERAETTCLQPAGVGSSESGGLGSAQATTFDNHPPATNGLANKPPP
jgi:hypothetical protein